jgi:phosphatidylinositol-3-phosphatase
MRRALLALLAFVSLAGSCLGADQIPPIQTVFVIMLENNSWSAINGNSNAPYLNNVLLPMASHCENYFNLAGIHPSLPNYLWLEAGTNFGIFDDNDPGLDHLNATNHLTTLLNNAGISWKAYQEHVDPNTLPLTTGGGVSSRHNPFIYFDDVTCTNDPGCPYGLAHIRPYTELAGDLANARVARYNFIIPDDCHDMHSDCTPGGRVSQGDIWLSNEVPAILNSAAFANGGALFILFDETDNAETRLPMLVISQYAWGGGYASTVNYTHSSFLRTMQDHFNVGPYLGEAAAVVNLADLFIQTPPATSEFRITQFKPLGPGNFYLTVSGVSTGSPLIFQTSSDLVNWTSLSTNASPSATFSVRISHASTTSGSRGFYRFMQESP